MGELFPVRRDDDGIVNKCRIFASKHCHPLQIGTGVLFGTIGIGLTAAGVLYADGVNFAFQTVAKLPEYASAQVDLNATADYVRDSYKESMSSAVQAGWKQMPFSYCIGHYVGGRIRGGAAKVFGRR